MANKPKDPVAEAAERLERVRERRGAIERLPAGPQRDQMLQANTTALMKAEAELGTLQAGPTQTLWERGSLAVSDWLNEKLMIEETFQDAQKTGLPESEGNMGRLDRARHVLWTSKLAERYGPEAAFVITTLKEGENFFFDPIKKLGLIGSPKHTTDSIREEQFESIKEAGRDLRTNIFSLKNMPTGPDGKPRAFTPEEARQITENMVTTPTPLNERQVAPAVSDMPREPAVQPSAPVYPEALPEGLELAPGDSGRMGDLSLPVGAPDPKGGSQHLEIKAEDRRGIMNRRDL